MRIEVGTHQGRSRLCIGDVGPKVEATSNGKLRGREGGQEIVRHELIARIRISSSTVLPAGGDCWGHLETSGGGSKLILLHDVRVRNGLQGGYFGQVELLRSFFKLSSI